VTHRFGRFALVGDTRQLLADGRDVHVSPKAFDLLLLLVEQRSRAVSKAELQERLWPATFVGETNLATLVAEIRRALDDSAHQSRYVRTVHRFGYRFVADVADAPPPADVRSGTRMYLTTADRHFELRRGPTVIGRAEDATIRLDSGGVSRHHARVVVDGDEARVEDLGSKNGTFVDGRRLRGACVLREGAELRVGSLTLTFRIVAPEALTQTLPVVETTPESG
jgi:DNA-binding winged helix-turn-helix (wHTH) protein